MATDCAIGSCTVQALGACLTCGKAFCLTHQAKRPGPFGVLLPIDFCGLCEAARIRSLERAAEDERLAKYNAGAGSLAGISDPFYKLLIAVMRFYPITATGDGRIASLPTNEVAFREICQELFPGTYRRLTATPSWDDTFVANHFAYRATVAQITPNSIGEWITFHRKPGGRGHAFKRRSQKLPAWRLPGGTNDTINGRALDAYVLSDGRWTPYTPNNAPRDHREFDGHQMNIDALRSMANYLSVR